MPSASTTTTPSLVFFSALLAPPLFAAQALSALTHVRDHELDERLSCDSGSAYFAQCGDCVSSLIPMSPFHTFASGTANQQLRRRLPPTSLQRSWSCYPTRLGKVMRTVFASTTAPTPSTARLRNTLLVHNPPHPLRSRLRHRRRLPAAPAACSSATRAVPPAWAVAG